MDSCLLFISIALLHHRAFARDIRFQSTCLIQIQDPPLLITSTMRSSITFAIAACLVAAIQCSVHSGYGASRHPRYENCAPSQNGSCSGCGTDYVQCGSNTCYNPQAGETCCSNACECNQTFPVMSSLISNTLQMRARPVTTALLLPTSAFLRMGNDVLLSIAGMRTTTMTTTIARLHQYRPLPLPLHRPRPTPLPSAPQPLLAP